MIFRKNFEFQKKKFILFYEIQFFYVITPPETLKGSRNIQGFALIRAVLLLLFILFNYYDYDYYYDYYYSYYYDYYDYYDYYYSDYYH